MKKFTQSDIKKIIEAQTLIQDLKKRQDMAFDVLLLNLPDLTRPDKDLIFDYCYNNYTHTLSLGEDGLKIEKIFPEPVPDFKSDINENTTEEDCKKAFEKFQSNRLKKLSAKNNL